MMDKWHIATNQMRNVCIPTIVGFGILGNIFSCIVLSSNKMKKRPCSVLLISLSIVDIMFLLCVLTSWLDDEVYPLLLSKVGCQFHVYVTYVTSFICVWCIVAVTCARFLATSFPLKCRYICSKLREKVTVLVIICAACVLYSYNFWTTTVVTVGNKLRCSYRRESLNYLMAVSWVDTLLTMVIPFCGITVMNVAMTRVLFRNNQTMNSYHNDVTGANTRKKQDRLLLNIDNNQRDSSRKVTKTIWLISTTFLVLNLPAHVLRLYNLISATITGSHEVSAELYFFQELTNMLNYVAFSCNVLLYTLSGREYRHAIKSLFCRGTAKKRFIQVRSRSAQHEETML